MNDPQTRNIPLIVAVDGPAGSGKSSVCSEVAKRIGWTYVNTGAIYRAVGLLAKDAGVDLSNEQALAAQVRSLAKKLSWDGESHELCFDGERLGARLYSSEATMGASAVAKLPLVREELLPLQRQLVMDAPIGAIVDGRDIGTVVFPDAPLKVFLTASLEERAKRRMHQMNELVGDIEDVKQDIAARDDQDTGRGTAPLRVAEDAEVLDTSHLDREATIQRLIDLLVEHNLVKTL